LALTVGITEGFLLSGGRSSTVGNFLEAEDR